MSSYITKERILSLLLVIITLALYFKVTTFNFVNWDDNHYILYNDHVQSGLTWDSIKWAFTTFHASNWHPLTWLSHILDFEIYGFHPAGHHLVNVFLHLTNSLLLFYFFNTATGALWRSFLLALIFAIHPVHVESVAWVSERKDVLSAFFWLLAMIFYLRFVRERTIKNYVLVLLSFILGLLSKPMVVTLPFVLLLLDFWPFNRINFSSNFLSNLKHLLIEKIPLIFLSLASSIVTYIAQKAGGSIAPIEMLNFKYRLINSIISYLEYIINFFYPLNLNFLYLHPITNYSFFLLFVSIMTILAISVVTVLNHSKNPYLLVGWLWFMGTLVPVIGLVQVGIQSMADRYLYIPLVGLLLLTVWPLSLIKKRLYKGVLIAVLLSFIMAISILAWEQIDVWKTSKSLFTRALEINPKNHLALSILGQELAKEGNIDEGLSYCEKALRLNPNFAETYMVIGTLYLVKNKHMEAIDNFEKALKIKPSLRIAQMSLGEAYLRNNEPEKALTTLNCLDKLSNKDSWLLNRLGAVWSQLGRYDKALEEFNSSLKIRPSASETLNNIAVVYLKKGEVESSKKYLEKALKISPFEPDILNNYGNALAGEEKFEDAIYSYLLALRINPDNNVIRKNLNESIHKFSKKLKNPLEKAD